MIYCRCSPVFIIHQPSAIEELRKWTSLEAIGDVTVMPDCFSRVNNNCSMTTGAGSFSINATISSNQHSGTLLSITPPSPLSSPTASMSNDDEADNVTVISAMPSRTSRSHNTISSRHQLSAHLDANLPLDHRLPSPEEQCLTLAAK